jgi:hypothetical protein
VHQIFINHRIGGFIESNKRDIFENIGDYQLRKLLLSMANIIPEKNAHAHFKPVQFLSINESHQALILNKGFDINNCGQIYKSQLLTIKSKGKNQFKFKI